MPCTDGAYGINDHKANITFSQSQDQQEDSHTDECSPFCACNCCAGFAIISYSYQIGLLYFPSIEKNTAHLPVCISEISLPIWQPPQLG
jgi:hypothetical protein